MDTGLLHRDCALLVAGNLYNAPGFTQLVWASEAVLWEPATLGKTPVRVCGIRQGFKAEPDSLLTRQPRLEAPTLEMKVSPLFAGQAAAVGVSWHKLLLSPERGLSPLIPAPAELEEQP